MKTARRSCLTGHLILVNLGVLAIVAGTALCADEKRPTKQAATPRPPLRLHGLRWHAELQEALKHAEADEGERADKPVFCLRVLGDLTGYM